MVAMNQVNTAYLCATLYQITMQCVQCFMAASAPVNDQGTYRVMVAGSSACVNGKFYCTNKGYTPQHLNASMVDDTFCGELVPLPAHLASTSNPHD